MIRAQMYGIVVKRKARLSQRKDALCKYRNFDGVFRGGVFYKILFNKVYKTAFEDYWGLLGVFFQKNTVCL